MPWDEWEGEGVEIAVIADIARDWENKTGKFNHKGHEGNP